MGETSRQPRRGEPADRSPVWWDWHRPEVLEVGRHAGFPARADWVQHYAVHAGRTQPVLVPGDLVPWVTEADLARAGRAEQLARPRSSGFPAWVPTLPGTLAPTVLGPVPYLVLAPFPGAW